ncbi:hypothetical protein Lp19_1177 [Lactiplantibacillus plantarum]|uniref:Uncharacterized protein n=1 Tax=Lactiplantibacillus plantarum TaxID=1590 RepID=A0A165RVB7_LACPN|nr:hypothetical protein [Lactiplantibacillus plantarum]KZU95898.1 hypothetical protein Lp19_1177 [Lactiplantibacillus plantarum]
MKKISIDEAAARLGTTESQLIDALNILGYNQNFDLKTKIELKTLEELKKQKQNAMNLVNINRIAVREHLIHDNFLKFCEEKTVKRKFLTDNCFLTQGAMYVNKTSVQKLINSFLTSEHASATVIAPKNSRFHILDEVLVQDKGFGRIIGFKKVLGTQYYDVALYNKAIVRSNHLEKEVDNKKIEKISSGIKSRASIAFKINLSQIQSKNNRYNLNAIVEFATLNKGRVSKLRKGAIFFEVKAFVVPCSFFNFQKVSQTNSIEDLESQRVHSFMNFINEIDFNNSATITTAENKGSRVIKVLPSHSEIIKFYVSKETKDAISKAAAARQIPESILLNNIFSLMQLFQAEDEDVISLLERINDYTLKNRTRGE